MIFLTNLWKANIMNATKKKLVFSFVIIKENKTQKYLNTSLVIESHAWGFLRLEFRNAPLGSFILPCPALQQILMEGLALSPAHLLMFATGIKYVLVKVKLLSV